MRFITVAIVSLLAPSNATTAYAQAQVRTDRIDTVYDSKEDDARALGRLSIEYVSQLACMGDADDAPQIAADFIADIGETFGRETASPLQDAYDKIYRISVETYAIDPDAPENIAALSLCRARASSMQLEIRMLYESVTEQ